MTTLYVLPALFALFVWWFSTGAIMFLDGLPRRTFKYSMAAATLLLAASFYGLWATSADTSLRGAYLAFTCGLTAWGWQEISFYMGFVTGPRSAPCPEGCRGWAHFLHAIETSLWHELAIIVAAVSAIALAWHGANQVGVWTFMVLWWMHQSAKLNVFLGVRNLNEEFLPEHLQFLRSFLTKKSMNLLFPISVTVSTVILVYLIEAATAAAATPFERAGRCFVATLMALAILEHWLLMLPLPAAALWGWSLKSRTVATPFDVEVVSGFLGAGKTTFLRARLAEAGPRTVVLVNDFAAVGVDGALLEGRGADVVELSNGCICCSLRSDLARQLKTVVAAYAPQRVLIEPSGVADLASLIGVLSQPDLGAMLRSRLVTTVLDAGSFLADYARMPGHIEAQVRLASVLVVNKTDLATPVERRLVETTLRMLNPAARLVPAAYGVALAEPATDAPTRAPKRHAPAPSVTRQHAEALHAHDHHPHGHEHEAHAHDGDGNEGGGHERHDHAAHDHAAEHGDALGLASWSASLGQDCDAERLAALLDSLPGGAFGDVERVKGIARAGDGWIRFDVAGGRPSMAAFAPPGGEAPRVVAIGRQLDAARLQRAFDECVASGAGAYAAV